MPTSLFTSEHNAPYDWLSDLKNVFEAQASWNDGSYQQFRTEHLLYQSDGPFAIACGAGLLAEHIRNFRITPAVIQRLGQVTDAQGRSEFQESFLNHLQRLKLRVQVNIAPEGMLLLPGEPILTVQGPALQVRLLESAFRVLLWQSTHWATELALARWQRGDFKEEDTPSAPTYPSNIFGWKMRAAYIGGASSDEILHSIAQATRPMLEGEGLRVCERVPGEPLAQVRRLFKGNQALGDLWLTQKQEETASVSKTSTQLQDEKTQRTVPVTMSRFQNIYLPVLVKGHPALANQRLAYLRQRTLKQLDIFRPDYLAAYPHGWLV